MQLLLLSLPLPGGGQLSSTYAFASVSFAFAVGYTAGFIFIRRMDTTYASPAGSRCAGSSPPGAGTGYVTKEASPVAFCPVGYCPVGSYSGSRSRATSLTTAIVIVVLQ